MGDLFKFIGAVAYLGLVIAGITVGVGTSLAVWHAADVVSNAVEGGCAAAQLIGALK